MNILIISTKPGFGGREIATINLYKNLLQYGHKPYLLTVKDSFLEKESIKQKINYFTYKTKRIFGTTLYFNFTKHIAKICKENKIDIIHCNCGREVLYASKIKNALPKIPIVLTQHNNRNIKKKLFQKTDIVLPVSKRIEKILYTKNKLKNWNIGQIKFLPPYFDADSFLNTKSILNKEEYFKKHFNINIGNAPLIACIGNILENKNQSLLLKAIHKLIYERNKKVSVIFIGKGSKKKYQEKCLTLKKELKLEHYAHFLGHSSNVPTLLNYADMEVLPSQNEAFGIVHMEAAILGKTIIGTKNTGAENIIEHMKTGLLFENNNASDLADQIEMILNKPKLVKQLNLNAYNFIINNCLPIHTTKKLDSIYRNLIENKSRRFL